MIVSIPEKNLGFLIHPFFHQRLSSLPSGHRRALGQRSTGSRLEADLTMDERSIFLSNLGSGIP